MTGADISAGMLAQASEAADRAGVEVEWIQVDARELQLKNKADGAICLCEGSFGLIGSPDEALTQERRTLEAIYAATKPGSKLILTAPNGLRKIREATPEQVESGDFDPLTLMETFEMELDKPEGSQKIQLHERGFVPSELRLLLESTGFEVEAIFGGTAGAWNRQTPALDEMEIMAIACRK